MWLTSIRLLSKKEEFPELKALENFYDLSGMEALEVVYDGKLKLKVLVDKTGLWKAWFYSQGKTKIKIILNDVPVIFSASPICISFTFNNEKEITVGEAMVKEMYDVDVVISTEEWWIKVPFSHRITLRIGRRNYSLSETLARVENEAVDFLKAMEDI